MSSGAIEMRNGPPHMRRVLGAVLSSRSGRCFSFDERGIMFVKDLGSELKGRVGGSMTWLTSSKQVAVSPEGQRVALCKTQAEQTEVVLLDVPVLLSIDKVVAEGEQLPTSHQAGVLHSSVALDFIKAELQRTVPDWEGWANTDATSNVNNTSPDDEAMAKMKRRTEPLRMKHLAIKGVAITNLLAVTAHSAGFIVLWDIARTPEPLAFLSSDTLSEDFVMVALSEDGRVVTGLTQHNKVVVWLKLGMETEYREHAVFEHLPPEESHFMRYHEQTRCVMVGLSKLNMLSLDTLMRHEAKTHEPRCCATRGIDILLGCSAGNVFQLAPRLQAVTGGLVPDMPLVRTCSIDTDNITRDVLSVAATPDGNEITAAMLVQQKLQFITWSLEEERTHARLVALCCMHRENVGRSVGDLTVPSYLERLLEFVCASPARDMMPGTLGTMTAVGLGDGDYRVQVVVLEQMLSFDSSASKLRVVSLPLEGPYEVDGLEDYAGRHLKVPASAVRPRTQRATYEESEQQETDRMKVQLYAASMDPMLHKRLNPQGTHSPTLVGLALRAANLNVIEAAKLLENGVIRDDGLGKLIPELEE